MVGNKINFILGLIATGGLVAFITGLAYSISTGFAGFWGGLPFWIISMTVLALAIYNFYEETIKKK
ncbi:MAG: hypothetical protein JKY41_09765 [Rhodobacteraceae bacterium]|nr:hypothetical protein [Paracoccaceae bacterium]